MQPSEEPAVFAGEADGGVDGGLAPADFPVEVPGFRGSLSELVRLAQRGEVDVSAVPVGAITQSFRERVAGPPPHPAMGEVADFLTLMARLVSLKAAAVLPEHAELEGEPEPEESDLGRRLAEYRLFKAAADALLADAVEEGARSFLGMVSPEVIPVERMRIPPERLAAAFRAVLERLEEDQQMPVGAATFSVEDKVSDLRRLLGRGPVRFEEIFNGVATRLEAVACFLALLELLKRGEATVDQPQAFGPITVTGGG